MRALALIASIALAPSALAEAHSVTAITWNLQSGQSSIQHVSDQAGEKGPIDIWGLSEVQNQAALDVFEQTIEAATGQDYTARLSNRGGADRLAILFRTEGFEIVEDAFEIGQVAVRNGLRPGFGIELEELVSGLRFTFLVNHLKCCSDPEDFDTRVLQARALNAFAEGRDGPVILSGDLNTFFRIDGNGTLPPALAELTINGPFKWIRPEVLVRTEDTGPTVLDYFLVAHPVEGWSAKSTILRRDGNALAVVDAFSDTFAGTDHRPVRATFSMVGDARIEQLREEITMLEAALEAKRLELERLLAGLKEEPSPDPEPEPRVVIDHAIPNPVGTDANNEVVALRVTGSEAVSVDGWLIGDDDTSGGFLLEGLIEPGPATPITLNPAGSLKLGNGGDLILLIDAGGEVVHQLSYPSAGRGQKVFSDAR